MTRCKMNELTDLECGMMQCVFCGMSNIDVAKLYKISAQTIKNHITDLLRKTGSKDRLNLAIWWWRYAVTGNEKPVYTNTKITNSHLTRIKNATGRGVTKMQWEEIMSKYGYRCVCCHTNEKVGRDHIIPLCNSGPHDVTNVQPLCPKCNSAKGTKTIDYRPDTN